jgi:hypothetical protein
MAASTGIVLAVGTIGAGNEWIHGHGEAGLRIGVATLLSAVVFAGIEKLPGGRGFAVAVATVGLVTVLFGSVTPGVPSPAAQIIDALGYGKRK